MKPAIRLLQTVLLAAAIVILPPVARGATDLEKDMKVIGQNAKILEKIADNPSRKDDALAAVGKMIQSAEKVRTLTPKKTGEIPEGERAQFVKDFQNKIGELIAQLKQVETALRDGKTADAKSAVAKLRFIKREGHEKFASD